MPSRDKAIDAIAAIECLDLEYMLLSEGKLLSCLPVSLGSPKLDAEFRKKQIRSEIAELIEVAVGNCPPKC